MGRDFRLLSVANCLKMSQGLEAKEASDASPVPAGQRGPFFPLTLRDLVCLSQASTRSWRAVGEVILLESVRSEGFKVELAEGTFYLTEWDDRWFAADGPKAQEE